MTASVVANKKGVALLVVLWVTVVLTILVNMFMVMVRTEAEGISNYKQETDTYYLARSGVYLAIQTLLKEASDEDPAAKVSNASGWKRDGRSRIVSMTKGSVTIRVMDESGKIGINQSQRPELVRVLWALGVKGVEKDTIADAILDWRDENNLHHLNGAEDDYYAALSPPYGAKDGPLDTVDELLWVKGVTPEIFFGSREIDETSTFGMTDVFTVYNDAKRVNINTASLGVLLSLPGVDAATAQRLIEARARGPIQNMADFAVAGGKLIPGISKYIRFNSRGIYSIEATGRLAESPIAHSMKATVQIEGKGQYRILYWKDQTRARGGAV